MKTALTSAVALFALAVSSAWGQDYGREWMDRVVRQLEQEKAPLSPKPLDVRFFAGERVFWDSNVYLQDEDEKDDTIFVTFGNVRLDYAEENFDAALDLQANYNYYVHEDDASGHEERLFGRARWAGSDVQVELSEIFRRESDPYIDPTIVERVERIVTTTVPRVSVWVTKVVMVEANGEIQYVKFDEDIFEGSDNLSWRAGLLGSYELPSGIQVLVDGGILGIDYTNDPTDDEHPGMPDVEGYYVRGGFRGDAHQKLYMSLLAGVTRAASDSVSELGIKSQRRTTGDVSAILRFEASERVTIHFDFTRRVSFGSWSSYAIVNRAAGGLDYAAAEKLKVTIRGQYDLVQSPDYADREYGSISAGANYTVFDNLVLDATATYRQGKIDGTNIDFVDGIISVGAAVTF